MKWNCRKLPRQVQSSVKDLRSLPGGVEIVEFHILFMLFDLFAFQISLFVFQNERKINTSQVIDHIHL